MKIKTATVDIPDAGTSEFQEAVAEVREDARIGRRISRQRYLAEMERRDAQWFSEGNTGSIDKLSEAFRQDQAVAMEPTKESVV